MTLRLVCKDPESPNNGSPTLYFDDQVGTYIFQSWKVSDLERLASIEVPDHETVIEFPSRLLALFPHVGRAESGCKCRAAAPPPEV
ncbi:hypothetical protein [Streptomyces sp. NPDC056401]|uniref:hypothetical protein n=1 Tax=Streptomyces sp. NPDC056401 TaxID=3345809 RepID=UPI0035D5FAAD